MRVLLRQASVQFKYHVNTPLIIKFSGLRSLSLLSSKANTDVRGEMRNAEEIIRADIFYKSSPSLSTDSVRLTPRG